MSSITTASTVEKLQANHGLPETIVSDNGPSFTIVRSSRRKMVFIIIITSSPYHPSTNGLAERAVQSFKLGVTKIQSGSVQSHIMRIFNMGDKVLVRDFRAPTHKVKWMDGKVLGPLSYQVEVENGLVRQHVDNMYIRACHITRSSHDQDMSDKLDSDANFSCTHNRTSR